MITTGTIRPHMAIIGGDGGHIGTVVRRRAGPIPLTRADDPDGTASHQLAFRRPEQLISAWRKRCPVPARLR